MIKRLMWAVALFCLLSTIILRVLVGFGLAGTHCTEGGIAAALPDLPRLEWPADPDFSAILTDIGYGVARHFTLDAITEDVSRLCFVQELRALSTGADRLGRALRP